ncbi:general transcription factor 3C polypeptide 6 [Arctopsyche grandis]|uniref:general transcription factor 3C polypeptide 6 n=1 Tax=Arctopsyche grandis TaxID=121162 RepID=UPI00406D8115
MNPQYESESDSEEEILVYADIKSLNLKKLLKPDTRPFFRVVGLETDSPFVQINEYVLKGEYVDCMGTNLFFEESSNLPDTDPMFGEEQKVHLDFVCKSNKNLNLERVFLKSKDEASQSTELQDGDATKNVINEPNSSSMEEAIGKFVECFDKNRHNLPISKVNDNVPSESKNSSVQKLEINDSPKKSSFADSDS